MQKQWRIIPIGGIKEMIEHFGIQQEETLVIDSDNDRAMFDFGHYTVAMKNARQEIKDITDEVTEETNEEDGAKKFKITIIRQINI